jgi:hypothetical protein
MHESNKPKRSTRIASLFVFMFMLAVTANAYTIVMRGGRRIEIPPQFIVTASTLTYEAAPGFQITLQMATIDIPATERANNEAPGSLWRRGQLTQSSLSTQSPENDVQSSQATQARRTITNRDLESAKRRRHDSESAYEGRRKQLGLPSVEESRRRAAAESAAIGIELEQRRAVERESEDYWRGRASALRTEMVELDAEIAWIQGRLDQGSFSPSNGWGNGSFSTVTSVVPFLSFENFGRSSYGNYGASGFPSYRARRPGVYVAPGQDSRTTSRGFRGRGTRGRGLFNSGSFPYPPFGVGVPYPGYPSIYGPTVPDYDYSYERSELITHFNELAAARAGLNARWRALEEEARRAGAPPGWLRP